MIPHRSVGIVYNAVLPSACEMGARLASLLKGEGKGWACSAEDLDTINATADNTDLIVTVGGDGTILRAVKLASLHAIPILGINMGRLGFMTELQGRDALEKLPQYLDASPWIEERTMLQVQIMGADGTPKADVPPQHGLNDAVVGRNAVSRLVTVAATIDGGHVTTYRADAVIVATATGSTGYNLAVGGPILYPQADAMVITPVAPHLGLAAGLVVAGGSEITFNVESDTPAMLSVDGYLDLPLQKGEGIRVTNSPLRARFLRLHPPAHFFHTLTRRLDFGGALPRVDNSMG